MAARDLRRCRTWAAIIWALFCACATASADDPSAARGRRLFEAGLGSNGRPVDAVMAGSATPIPGALLSCAGCHGHDGKGRTARGMEAPDITWENLTKPYALRAGVGRVRPAYNDALLVGAVMGGRDSAGHALSAAMPRFRLTPADAADLVAYLRELGSRPDPGISADVVSIGVIVPPRDHVLAAQDAVRTALATYAEELNRAGGIFGRRIEFAFFETVELDEAQSSEQAATIEQAVLAAVVASGGKPNQALGRHVRQLSLPVVAVHADNDMSPPQNVFYLSAGVTGELAALAMQASRDLTTQPGKIAVVYRDDPAGRDRMAALRPWLARAGWRASQEIPLPAADSAAVPIEALQQIESADAVLIATPDPGIGTILSHLDNARRDPLVLLPGSVMVREWLPAGLGPQARILFAFESINRPGAGPSEHGIAVQQQAHLAFATAQLLIEGLRRAGRKVTRAKLVEAIETIQRFETGTLPALNYGLRQHVGFTGADILAFDPQERRLLPTVRHIRLD